jgi:hypothetical protein
LLHKFHRQAQELIKLAHPAQSMGPTCIMAWLSWWCTPSRWPTWAQAWYCDN